MEICFLIPSMAGGGAERVISNLANEMAERNILVSILMTSSNDNEYILNKKIKCINIGSRTYGGIKGIYNRICILRSYYKEHKKTFYISMETNTNLYALIASIGLGIKIIVSERNDPDKYPHRLLRDIIYSILGKKFVFQTKDAKARFCSKIRQKGVIIKNPVKTNLPLCSLDDKNNTIVAVGRFEKQKNYTLLIEAFALFSNEYPDYMLHIYGKGSQEAEIRRVIKENRLENKIIMQGFRENVWDIERDAKIYVLSSDYEGMPNSLIEAMAVGKAVISTDCPIGGPRELIQEDINGILTPIGDTNSLYSAMKKYADNDELCDKMSLAATEVREMLHVKKICSEWLDYIKK